MKTHVSLLKTLCHLESYSRSGGIYETCLQLDDQKIIFYKTKCLVRVGGIGTVPSVIVMGFEWLLLEYDFV